MIRTVLLILVILSTASAVFAQTSQGPAPSLRDLHAADTGQVTTRRSDSILNGALIGAGAGVASGLFLCRLTEPWENCFAAGPMLGVGAIGAGIGIGIDLLIRGKTISSADPGSARVTAAPLVGRRAGGLHLSVNF
jgi:hypothetical protein